MGSFEATQSEDCLYLTIWSPAHESASRPVVLWLHGGGFMTGAGSAPWYDGAALARACNAIVVNVNYRLGALGFLAIPGMSEGNLALLDQTLALQWVRENIHAFGGDADRVTVIGQSGGGHNIASLLTVPQTEGLFRRAVLLSPPLGIGLHSEQEAARTRETFLRFCDVPHGQDQVRTALRELPVDRILGAQSETARALGRIGAGDLRPPFMPTSGHPHRRSISSLIGEAALAASARNVQVMIGWTREEANLFYYGQPPSLPIDDEGLRRLVAGLPYGETEMLTEQVKKRRPDGTPAQWFMDAVADVTFRLPCIRFADTVVRTGGDAYVYQFDWQSPVRELGACHCIDLPFFFGNFQHWSSSPMLAGVPEDTYRKVSTRAMKMLAKFVNDGDPGFSRWNGNESSIHHLE